MMAELGIAGKRAAPPPARGHIPGEAGIWVFVLGDLLMFALAFVLFTYYRAGDPALFAAGQATLNQNYGVINTLLLLSSSWFVVLAIHAAKDRAAVPAANFLVLAFACGGGFVAVKFMEYGEKLRAGLSLTTNDFFMYYYVLTGLHFAHVAIGMVVLIFLWRRCRAGIASERDIGFLESGATYWHMVDVLWIILFPLIYLLK
ncbi:MAG: cytochrome c oxidase subunit 3 family protein [Proteobacteria bacterium]|nr:cytochrome c oxidase subunit 3 family protein [Pseudomonadota bacterium]